MKAAYGKEGHVTKAMAYMLFTEMVSLPERRIAVW